MTVTPMQAQKILTGSHKFSQLGFSMLITRLKGRLAKDADALQNCSNEINTFLQKYGATMPADLSIISKL